MKSGSQRRSRLEIYINVLENVRNGESKATRIMYDANLSWHSAKRTLGKLVDEGYLNVTENNDSRRTKRTYNITAKGISVLKYFKGAEKLLDIKL